MKTKRILFFVGTIIFSFSLFMTSCDKDDDDDTIDPNTFTDSRDGQTYKFVKIGNQTWMKENLSYNAGTGSWVYADNSANADIYGRLYNWEIAKQSCPTGWHLPVRTDWEELFIFLGGMNNCGGKMKETGTSHWKLPNEGATNESGFTALPGGSHVQSYTNLGTVASFWSATAVSAERALNYTLSSNFSEIKNLSTMYKKVDGISVRCLQD